MVKGYPPLPLLWMPTMDASESHPPTHTQPHLPDPTSYNPFSPIHPSHSPRTLLCRADASAALSHSVTGEPLGQRCHLTES